MWLGFENNSIYIAWKAVSGGSANWGQHHQLSPLHLSRRNVVSDAFADKSFSDRKIAAMTMPACMMKQLVGRDLMPASLSGTLRKKFNPPIALTDKNVMKCGVIGSRQADGQMLVWIAGIKHSIPNPRHTSGNLDLYFQNWDTDRNPNRLSITKYDPRDHGSW